VQQVWCGDNHVTILYFYVTFKIIKCDEILLKKTDAVTEKFALTENELKLKNCNENLNSN